MKSFLKQIEEKFIVIESADYCDACDRPMDQCICKSQEIDEISGTGGVAGYNIPAAFAAPGKWRNKNKTYESVNKPADWTLGSYQKPEDEEEYTDKFSFAENDGIWQHKNYEYPSKNLTGTPRTASKKDKTKKIKHNIDEMLDSKYEQLIESYRSYATGNAKLTPESKIKHTIKEVAKQLQSIEQTVKYASQLKNESGVARNGYGPSVDNALNKISERLIKISERVRALGE